MRIALALAAAAVGATLVSAKAKPFDWMVGDWCTAVEADGRTCESWSGWAAGTMRGESRTIKGGKLVESEATTISIAGGRAVYDAAPAGAKSVRFTEAGHGAEAVIFENRAHDYPQRIRYWREGADLLAEISLADGSRPMRWRYRRMPADRPLR
jgi:hypothetical protein